MTGFATGVQRWCSCLDCVLTGLVWPPALCLLQTDGDFCRFASGLVRFA
jgi:hypothetical protein